MAYRTEDYEPHAIVFQQGDEGTFMCLVQHGTFEVIQELGGHEKQVAVMERGEFFGEMSLLEDQPRSHSVRAAEDGGKLILIERDEFPNLLTKKPDVSVRMVSRLARRLFDLEDMLVRAWAGAGMAQDAPGASADGYRSARLQVIGTDTQFDLPPQSVAHIGRQDPVNDVHPDVDLSPIDPQLTTSRRHAKILQRAGSFYLLEERATNGTFVNGQRISTELPFEIRSGDDLMFGALRMRFATLEE